MSKQHLSNNPKRLKVNNETADAWFYEEGKGFEIVVEINRTAKDGGRYNEYHHVTITWATIMASARRYLKR